MTEEGRQKIRAYQKLVTQTQLKHGCTRKEANAILKNKKTGKTKMAPKLSKIPVELPINSIDGPFAVIETAKLKTQEVQARITDLSGKLNEAKTELGHWESIAQSIKS